MDDKARTFQTVFKVDAGPQHILQAHGIDDQGDTFGHGQRVVLGNGIVKGKTVRKTRAAATGHVQAQLQARVAFFHDQLRHLGGSGGREFERAGHQAGLAGAVSGQSCLHGWTPGLGMKGAGNAKAWS